jgi:hypothetical protein
MLRQVLATRRYELTDQFDGKPHQGGKNATPKPSVSGLIEPLNDPLDLRID